MGNAESEAADGPSDQPQRIGRSSSADSMPRFQPLRRSRWRSRSASMAQDSELSASSEAFWAAVRGASESRFPAIARNQAMLGTQIAEVEVGAERASNRMRIASVNFCRACSELQGVAGLAEEVRSLQTSFIALLDQAEELRQLLESEPFVLGEGSTAAGSGGASGNAEVSAEDDPYAADNFSVAYRDL